MGANLVKRAFVYAIDVPLHPNEVRLLLFMSLTAMDDGTPPRYFDSREASALGLGRRVPDVGPERTAAFEAVKVALRGLVKLDAIGRLKAAHSGQRAEYVLRLDLDRTRRTAEFRRRNGEGRAFSGKKVQPSPIGRVGLLLPKAEPSPKEQQEYKEQLQDLDHADSTISLAPVDNTEGEAA